MKSSLIKRNGKLMLKDNWTAALGITSVQLMLVLLMLLLPSYALILFSPIAILSAGVFVGVECIVYAAAVFLLYYPLHVGKCGWYYASADGTREPVRTAFAFFESGKIGRSMLFGLLYILKMAGWMFVTALPMMILSVSKEIYPELATLAEVVSFFSWLALAAVVIFMSLRYYLTPYILASDNLVSVGDAFKHSARCMKGNKKFVVELYFSFTLWFASCIIVLPFIYVKPYFDASKGALARKIMESQPDKVSGSNSEQYTGGIPEEVIA